MFVSILTRNRTEPQHVDLGSSPAATSQKFKYERVTSKSFHDNHSPSQITSDNLVKLVSIVGQFDLRKLLNLVIKPLFVLHGFSTMTPSIKILLFDLPGFNPYFKIVLKLSKLPQEVVFGLGFRFSR